MEKIFRISKRLYAFKSPKYDPFKYVATGFEKKWPTLEEGEKHAIEMQLQDLERGDWHHLTKDQMRNSIPFTDQFLFLVYTAAYGLPEIKDKHEGKKLFAGVLAIMGISYGIFEFVRSFGNFEIYFLAQPPPRTMTPEYQEATKQHLKDIGTIPEGFYIEPTEEENKRVKL
jgi:cytochrome c oxidase subunit 4